MPKTPAEAWQKARIVFVGAVTQANREIVKFSVKEIFRGELGKEEQMDALLDTCKFPLEKGETYVVYTGRTAKGYLYGTSICSRTAKITDANDDLNFLREQHAPANH